MMMIDTLVILMREFLLPFHFVPFFTTTDHCVLLMFIAEVQSFNVEYR